MHMTFASSDFQTTCYLHLIYKCGGQLCQVSVSRDVKIMNFSEHFLPMTLWSSHYQSTVANQYKYKECLIHSYVVRLGNKWIDSLVIGNLIFIAHLSDTSLLSLASTSPGLQNLWLLVKTQIATKSSKSRTNLPSLSMPTGSEVPLTIILHASDNSFLKTGVFFF